MDVLHSQRWCVFVTLLFWCVVEILSRSPRVCLHAELLFLLKPNLLHVRQKYWYERNFHMNECFQINLGCYGSVRACVRARQPTYGMLRMQRWSCWWCYKRAAATKRCDETCYPRAERHEHRQQSRCRRDPAFPPPGCLLFQRHTAETRFSFISSQERWLSAHCVVYVFAFSPGPSICPAAPELTSNDTLRYRPVCCGPGLELQVRGQTVRWRSNQYTAGAIDTPPLSTILGTVWYVQQYRVLWKEGGAEGWQKGPHASRRENTREGTQSTERPGTKYPLQFIFNIKTGKLAPTTDSQHKFRQKDTLNTHKQKAWINI